MTSAILQIFCCFGIPPLLGWLLWIGSQRAHTAKVLEFRRGRHYEHLQLINVEGYVAPEECERRVDESYVIGFIDGGKGKSYRGPAGRFMSKAELLAEAVS